MVHWFVIVLIDRDALQLQIQYFSRQLPLLPPWVDILLLLHILDAVQNVSQNYNQRTCSLKLRVTQELNINHYAYSIRFSGFQGWPCVHVQVRRALLFLCS